MTGRIQGHPRRPVLGRGVVLELAIEPLEMRLDRAGEKQYDKVIRNRNSLANATIDLAWSTNGNQPEMDERRSIKVLIRP